MSKSLATILLVEDDPTLGYLLREYLTMNGFKISLAKTASEALQLLDSHIFELAILDGVSAYEYLKVKDSTPWNKIMPSEVTIKLFFINFLEC